MATSFNTEWLEPGFQMFGTLAQGQKADKAALDIAAIQSQLTPLATKVSALGTASTKAIGDFATAAQGLEADTAIARLNAPTNNYGQVYVNFTNCQVNVTTNTQLYFFPLARANVATIAASPLTAWPKAAGTNPVYLGSFITHDAATDEFTYRLKENPVAGQVHLWRVMAYYTRTGTGTAPVTCQMINDDTGLRLVQPIIMPSGATTGWASWLFMSVYDGSAKGYRLGVGTEVVDTSLKVDLRTITRVSLATELKI